METSVDARGSATPSQDRPHTQISSLELLPLEYLGSAKHCVQVGTSKSGRGKHASRLSISKLKLIKFY